MRRFMWFSCAHFGQLPSFILLDGDNGPRAAHDLAHLNNQPPGDREKGFQSLAALLSEEFPMNAAMEPHHYAVVTLDCAGQKSHGWDYETLDEAEVFADTLRREALLVEVWAQDQFGMRLARLLPGSNNKWQVMPDTEDGLNSACERAPSGGLSTASNQALSVPGEKRRP